MAAKTHPNKLLILQTPAGNRYHSELVFKELKVLNMYQIHVSCVSMFMFKYNQGLLPVVMNPRFLGKSNCSYAIRRIVYYNTPFCRTYIRQRSVFHVAHCLFNSVL